MLGRLCHWVLILSLVLNGIGSAAASVAMHVGASQTATTSHQATTGSRHGDTPAARHLHADTGHGHGGDSIAHEAPDRHDGDCSGDCCKQQGSCQCLCMHHAQALVPAFAGLTGNPGHEGGQAMSRTWHPSPPPGENIRPPIA